MAKQREKAVTAMVLLDCTINEKHYTVGCVVSGSAKALEPYIGDALDDSKAAVDYAVSEGAKIQAV